MQRVHELTLDIYRLTESFPQREIFGLSSQLRRACSSIGANLAEGCGRTQPEFARFVQIALGSAGEVEYHLLLARDLGFIEESRYRPWAEKAVGIKRMLTALMKAIQATTARRGKINSGHNGSR